MDQNLFEQGREQGRRAIFPYVKNSFFVQLYILSAWLALCAALLIFLCVLLVRRRSTLSSSKQEASKDQNLVSFVKKPLSKAFSSSTFVRATGRLFYIKLRGNHGEIFLIARIIVFLLFLQAFIYGGLDYWRYHHLRNTVTIFLTVPWPFILLSLSLVLHAILIRLLNLPLAPQLPAPLPFLISIAPFASHLIILPVIITFIVIATYRWHTAYYNYLKLDALSAAAEEQYEQTGFFNASAVIEITQGADTLTEDYRDSWKWIDYSWGLTALTFLLLLVIYVPILAYVSHRLMSSRDVHHPSPSFSASTWTRTDSDNESSHTTTPPDCLPRWKISELVYMWIGAVIVGAYYTGLLGWITFDSRPVEHYTNGFFEFYVLSSLYVPALASSIMIFMIIRRVRRPTKNGAPTTQEGESKTKVERLKTASVVKLDFFKAKRGSLEEEKVNAKDVSFA